MGQRYTKTAITLHWLMAIGFFALIALGFYMQDLPLSPTKLKLYSWHKWAGVSLFILALIRLIWRQFNPAPALPVSMSSSAKLAASIGHYALYACMFAIPLSGWLMSSAMGFQTVWFGLIPLPDLIARDKALAQLLASAHFYLNVLFIICIAGHILAALKHHFIDKDNLLARMR